MSYRDPVEAARARRDALAVELARLDEDDPRRAALESELASVHEIIEASRRKLALSVLSNVRIATPCPASWAAMAGDDRVRNCALCEKNVYDLAGLTAWESVQLLTEQGEKACVRLHRRRDGTVITADCEVGRGRRRKRRVLAAAGVLAVSAASALATTTPSPALPVARGAPIADHPALRLDEESFLYAPPALPEVDREALACMMGGCAVPADLEELLRSVSYDELLGTGAEEAVCSACEAVEEDERGAADSIGELSDRIARPRAAHGEAP